MTDNDRLDAVSDAIAEVESGMFDVAVVLGTNVSVIRNDVLDSLEGYETKYFELRKVLDRLDTLTKALPFVRLDRSPPKEVVRLYRDFRHDAIRILQGKDLTR